MFRDFEKIGGFDNVPVRFLTIANNLIWKYQRVLTKKASVKAIMILCNRGYSAGKVSPKLKPGIIRQEYNHYTYNWFLVVVTASNRHHQNQLRRKKLARREIVQEGEQEWTDDAGNFSSHSIEFGCL